MLQLFLKAEVNVIIFLKAEVNVIIIPKGKCKWYNYS